eukprot:scaffold33027_cov124-Isochrysis_galbana.AAC.1
MAERAAGGGAESSQPTQQPRQSLAHSVRENCPTQDKVLRDPLYRGGARQGGVSAPEVPPLVESNEGCTQGSTICRRVPCRKAGLRCGRGQVLVVWRRACRE